MNIPTLSLQDHFLIAMPGIADRHFSQSVVYVCAHSEEGAMGLVINHPMADLHLSQILEQVKIKSDIPKINQQPVLLGGPVQHERGFILHRPNSTWGSTLMTGSDMGVTSSQDILESMAMGAGPEETMVVLGCAGWSPGQIESEISENSWMTVPASADVIFHTPYGDRWRAALKLLGIDASQLSSECGHA